MKIKPIDSSMDIYKDAQTGIRYGIGKHGYEIDISAKEMKKIGFNIGFGVTEGCIAAYTAIASIYYACKAVKDYIDRHATIQEPAEETKPETEEAAEK